MKPEIYKYTIVLLSWHPLLLRVLFFLCIAVSLDQKPEIFTACLFCDVPVTIFFNLGHLIQFYSWTFKVLNLKKLKQEILVFVRFYTEWDFHFVSKRAFKRAFYSYETKVHFFFNCQLITPSFNSRTEIARGQIWDKYDFVL